MALQLQQQIIQNVYLLVGLQLFEDYIANVYTHAYMAQFPHFLAWLQKRRCLLKISPKTIAVVFLLANY